MSNLENMIAKLPAEMQETVLPASRVVALLRTSQGLRSLVHKLRPAAVAKATRQFRDGEGLRDALGDIGRACRLTELHLLSCRLGAPGAAVLAEFLRADSTLQVLEIPCLLAQSIEDEIQNFAAHAQPRDERPGRGRGDGAGRGLARE